VGEKLPNVCTKKKKNKALSSDSSIAKKKKSKLCQLSLYENIVQKPQI
jgi:hypothetical protein